MFNIGSHFSAFLVAEIESTTDKYHDAVDIQPNESKANCGNDTNT